VQRRIFPICSSPPRKYDLGAVGRYKFNKKFGSDDDSTEVTTLQPKDIVHTMSYLIQVFIREKNIDDIDHLGNRRVRSVGELLQNSLKGAFARMDKIAKERMSLMMADEHSKESAKTAGFHFHQADCGCGEGILRFFPVVPVHGSGQPAF